MKFFDDVRRLLRRAEVDTIERSTGLLAGHVAERQELDARMRALRLSVADDRHPDLTAAMKRRRNTVH